MLSGELLRTVGTANDQAVLNGSGGAQPQGVLNASGTGTQSGTLLSFANILTMRKTCALANTDDAAVAWIGTPAVRELLGAQEKISTAGRFCWENDLIDNRPAYVSTDVPSATLVLGDWSQIVLAI